MNQISSGPGIWVEIARGSGGTAGRPPAAAALGRHGRRRRRMEEENGGRLCRGQTRDKGAERGQDRPGQEQGLRAGGGAAPREMLPGAGIAGKTGIIRVLWQGAITRVVIWNRTETGSQQKLFELQQNLHKCRKSWWCPKTFKLLSGSYF
uniref:Uncharacterized protein n=1 Tax=Serinus canaria TaxID=9135 RepID=A0A8C9L1E5_SERCA